MSVEPGGSMETVEEEDSEVYTNTDSFRYRGLKEATGDQAVQRSFRACAVCVTVLCVLLAAGIIGVSAFYHSAITELQTEFDLEKDQWVTSNDNLTLENEHLQREVNQLKRETAVESCPSGWMTFGDGCYYRTAGLKSWEESRRQCLTIGAELVVINSREEQEFITRWTNGDHHGSWLGLKRTGGKWTWVDGTPLTTQFWGSGYPLDNRDDNCAVQFHGKGGWMNAGCTRNAFRMCEKK